MSSSHHNRKYLFVATLFLIIIMATPLKNLTGEITEGADSHELKNIRASPWIGQVIISSNWGFSNFASEGDGTSLNPYIIEGLRIDVNSTDLQGLVVESTTAHFIIRNCTIIGDPDAAALALESIGSGTATVENNTISNGMRCITMGYSHNVKIIGNTLMNPDQTCIELWRSNGCKVVNNSLSRDILGGNGVVPSENYNTTMVGNVITNFGTGISIYKASEFKIYNNTIIGGSTGIWFTEGVNYHIFGNTFQSCSGNGMLYGYNEDSLNGTIYENHFLDCGSVAIYFPPGNHNQTLFHNFFRNNNGVDVQGYDDSLDNQWYSNDLSEGNDWTDYSGTGNYDIPGTAGSADIYPNVTISAFQDADNDGLTDDSEKFTFLTEWDQNDTDADGLTDGDELLVHFSDPFDNDTDSDKMPDGWEVLHLLNPLVNDADKDWDIDGLTNLEEFQNETDPHDSDSDSDGMPDGWEVEYELDPTIDDADSDPDEDGLDNGGEYDSDTDPNDEDTDGDALSDGDEILVHDTDPNDIDSDDDSLSDGDEILVHDTDPNDVDSDGDGMPDGWEVDVNLDPSTDDAGSDLDHDGVDNGNEYISGTDPGNEDTDGDTMLDGWEIGYGLDPLADDSADDPDTDGLSNAEESISGTDPFDEDTDGDGMPDGWEVGYQLDPLINDSAEDADDDKRTNLDEFLEGTDPTVADSSIPGYIPLYLWAIIIGTIMSLLHKLGPCIKIKKMRGA